MDTGKILVQQNITFLKQGERLIGSIGSDYYARLSVAESLGTIGSHYRHILDMYRCFIKGIGQGMIRYDQRERDKNIEKSAQAAIEESNRLISGLKETATSANPEDPIKIQRILRGNETVHLITSIGRELDVLTSHTVHHYAIIALILNSHGIECRQDFGVAPSTLEYRNDDKT